jgi:hypothetical protein
VFETMTAKRSYKDAISPAAARVELTRCAGTHFDADIVRAFLNISLGRLRWAVGPASLIAQLPGLSQIPLVGGQATGALAGLTSATAIGVAALSMGSMVMPHMVAPAGANGSGAASRPASPAAVQLAMLSGTSSSLPAPVAVHPKGNDVATARGPAPGVSRPGPGTSPTTSTVVGTTVPIVPPPPTSTGSGTTTPPDTKPPVTTPPVTMPPVTVPPVTTPPVTAPKTTPPATKPPTGLVSGLVNGLLGLIGLRHS